MMDNIHMCIHNSGSVKYYVSILYLTQDFVFFVIEKRYNPPQDIESSSFSPFIRPYIRPSVRMITYQK